MPPLASPGKNASPASKRALRSCGCSSTRMSPTISAASIGLRACPFRPSLCMDAFRCGSVQAPNRLSAAWIIGPLTPLETVQTQMGIYRAALQEYDKEGTVDEFPMRRDVFIAEDR